jgi:hypothetical protein
VGLIFASQAAESTVESLINQRCKGKQHMRWTRLGMHPILQLRAAIAKQFSSMTEIAISRSQGINNLFC